MMSQKRRLYMVLLLTISSFGCMSSNTFADRVATPEWPELTERVNAYTGLVDRLEKDLTPLPEKATAAQIASHKAALVNAIRAARNGARQGDIFTPSLRERFLPVVRSETRGPAGKPAKRAILEDNPNQAGEGPVRLVVNAVYPDGAPLSTVPPTLLLRLPVLPETVDYRFVGKALVLRDTRANLIVDYIPNALM